MKAWGARCSHDSICMAVTKLWAIALQGASKSLVQLVTDLGNELKGSSEGKIVSIMEDFEHQIDGLGIKVTPAAVLCTWTCDVSPLR